MIARFTRIVAVNKTRYFLPGLVGRADRDRQSGNRGDIAAGSCLPVSQRRLGQSTDRAPTGAFVMKLERLVRIAEVKRCAFVYKNSGSLTSVKNFNQVAVKEGNILNLTGGSPRTTSRAIDRKTVVMAQRIRFFPANADKPFIGNRVFQRLRLFRYQL